MIRTIEQLKSQFAGRDTPTESDFNDLIDTLTAFNQGTLLPAAFRPPDDDSIMGSEGGVPAWLPKGLQTFRSSFFGHDQTNTDDYVVSFTPAPSSWAQLDGVPLTIRVDNANTTSSVTLKVGALPAKNMVAPNGNLLSAGILSNNFTFIAIYSADEDVVEVIAATASAVGPAGGDLTGMYPNPEIAAAAVDAAHINAGTMTVGYYLKLGAGNVLEWAEVVTDAGQPRPPNGPAGGSLIGTYPNPTIRDGVITPSNLVVPAGPSENQRLAYRSGGFEWVDDLSLSFITPVGIGHKYFNDTPPGNWSATAHEMTVTGGWVQLDLSAHVPDGARYVVIRAHAQWKSDASQSNAGYLDFSENGTTSLVPGLAMTAEMLEASTQRGQTGQQLVVPVNGDRHIWYRCSFGGFVSGHVEMQLLGFYSGSSQLGLPLRAGAVTVTKAVVVDYNDNSLNPTPDADISWSNSTGGFRWTVPTGITSVRVRMWGAGGGAYKENGNLNPGGSGAYVEYIRSVTPGDVIYGTVGKGGKGKGTAYTTGDANDIIGGETNLAIGSTVRAGGGALEDNGGDVSGHNPATDHGINGGLGTMVQSGLVGKGGDAPQGGRGGSGTTYQDYAEGYGDTNGHTYPAEVPGGGGGGWQGAIVTAPGDYALLDGAHGRVILEYLTPTAGGVRNVTQAINKTRSYVSAPADTWTPLPGMSLTIDVENDSDAVMLLASVYLSGDAFSAIRVRKSSDGVNFTEITDGEGLSDGVRPVAGSAAAPYAESYVVGTHVLHLVDTPGTAGTWHYRVEAVCVSLDMIQINGEDVFATQYTGRSSLTAFLT